MTAERNGSTSQHGRLGTVSESDEIARSDSRDDLRSRRDQGGTVAKAYDNRLLMLLECSRLRSKSQENYAF